MLSITPNSSSLQWWLTILVTRYISISSRITGWNAVKSRVLQLGYEMTDDQIKEVYVALSPNHETRSRRELALTFLEIGLLRLSRWATFVPWRLTTRTVSFTRTISICSRRRPLLERRCDSAIADGTKGELHVKNVRVFLGLEYQKFTYQCDYWGHDPQCLSFSHNQLTATPWEKSGIWNKEQNSRRGDARAINSFKMTIRGEIETKLWWSAWGS